MLSPGASPDVSPGVSREQKTAVDRGRPPFRRDDPGIVLD